MRNSFGVIILSALILAFLPCSAASAADSRVFQDPRLEAAVAGRPVTANGSLPTLEGILGRYILALGGKEAIERIRTLRLTGELIHDFPGQNPPKTAIPA